MSSLHLYYNIVTDMPSPTTQEWQGLAGDNRIMSIDQESKVKYKLIKKYFHIFLNIILQMSWLARHSISQQLCLFYVKCWFQVNLIFHDNSK